jgi:hypothetical protein
LVFPDCGYILQIQLGFPRWRPERHDLPHRASLISLQRDASCLDWGG